MKIKITKYTPCPQVVRLGTEGSYGVENIEFEFNEDWEGLQKKINFFPDDAIEGVTVILGDNNICSVPAEMTARAGIGKIVAEGFSEDKRIFSVTVRAMIETTHGTADKEPEAPTPSEIEQITLLAFDAKEKAAAVEKRANEGEFNAKIEKVTAESISPTDSASVENLGTPFAAKLHFKIPRGNNAVIEYIEGHAVSSLDDLKALLNSRAFKDFYIVNRGEAFDFTFANYNNNNHIETVTINKGDIVSIVVSAVSGDAYTAYVSHLDTAMLGDNCNIMFYEDAEGTARFIPIINGEKGDTGKGISKIERTSGTGAAGTTDIYTITYTDGTISSFTVYNGKDGTSVTVENITESTESGGSNTVEFSDGNSLTVKNGNDGVDADMYSYPLYKIYSLADIVELSKTTMTTGFETKDFKCINCGETFDYSGVTINTGDIFEFSSMLGAIVSGSYSYLNNSPISSEEGILIKFISTRTTDGSKFDRYIALFNGKDYILTDEDKAAIVNDVIAALPDGDEVAYGG